MQTTKRARRAAVMGVLALAALAMPARVLAHDVHRDRLDCPRGTTLLRIENNPRQCRPQPKRGPDPARTGSGFNRPTAPIVREVAIGAPATQWWINLSTAIVFGLGFATILTLVVTPAMLMGIEQMAQWRKRRFGEKKSHGTKIVPAE